MDVSSSDAAETRKLPSSKYKGLVPQPNGRWGAQIYEKHHRVWLGTFNHEAEAAKAYDIAAQRFRGRDAVVNLSPLSDAAEILFLNSHSKAEVVDMLRKHTYDDELEQSRRAMIENRSVSLGLIGGVYSSAPVVRELLFEKAVTPSDVGKLNRLVIPKQHAEKHFPLKITNTTTTTNNSYPGFSSSASSTKGALLNLEDAVGGKVWRFRYSYWNSSQSYVLTKGWSRFVKEKNLSAGDIVSFLRSVGPNGKLFIDWKPSSKNVAGGSTTSDQQYVVRPAVARPSAGVVRLFGVNIANNGDGGGDWDERRREMEGMIFSTQGDDYPALFWRSRAS